MDLPRFLYSFRTEGSEIGYTGCPVGTLISPLFGDKEFTVRDLTPSNRDVYFGR